MRRLSQFVTLALAAALWGASACAQIAPPSASQLAGGEKIACTHNHSPATCSAAQIAALAITNGQISTDTSLTSAIAAFTTTGNAAAGDGGAALWVQGSGCPALGKIASGSGQCFVIASNPVNPFMFGATGGSNDTTAAQNTATYAAANGLWADFLDKTLNVSTVTFPSNSRARNINFFAVASTVDETPVEISGSNASPASNVHLTNVTVNGNRVNQTNLTSSGGDGQRNCLGILGRVSNILIENATLTHCATDGAFLFGNGVVSSSDGDYLQTNVRLLNVNLQWNGRWGGSSMSQQGLVVTGVAKFNGLNLPGYPASPYTSGGNARTANGVLSGPAYGGSWDQEDEAAVGGGFNGETFDFADGTGNAGSMAVVSDVAPTTAGFALRQNLSVSGKFDVQNTAFNYPLRVTQIGSYSGTLPTFRNVKINAQTYVNSQFYTGVENLSVVGNASLLGGTGSNPAAIFTNDTNVSAPLSTDSTLLPALFFAPLPISVVSTTQTVGSGWTIGTPTLVFNRLNTDGSFTDTYTVLITPTGAGLGVFSVTLTSGATVSQVSGSFIDNNTAGVVPGYAYPSGGAANIANFGLTASGTDPVLVVVNMTLIP